VLNPFDAVITAMILMVRLLWFAILARVLYSWVDPNPFGTNRLKLMLYALTDPILEPLRRIVPPAGMFDLSPIVAFLVLRVVEAVLINLRGY